MDNNYVVFVDEDLVLGSMQMAAAEAVGLKRSGPVELSPTEELGLRRSVLGSLAATMTGGGAAAGTAGAARFNKAITVLADGGNASVEPTEDEGVRILEGANAIVIDADKVNVEALRQVVGLTILPNIELQLPGPVTVQTASTPPEDWHLRRIGLPDGAADGSGILIGVLDTGIDANHPEFAGKTIHFQEFNAAGRKVPGPARDAGDHGTHVCSIAAGKHAGVAPGADLAVAAVLTHRRPGSGMSGTLIQIVAGFDWLVKTTFRPGTPGVDLINASLGGGGFNPYLQQPVRAAHRIGIPLIAAIGNSGRSGGGRHGSPGNYPEVMSVGATDIDDVLADFSDWGVGDPPAGPRYPVPELCAPGVEVHAASPGGGFQRMSGTSMATPVVAGVAARRMAANAALVGRPAALFVELRRRLAPAGTGPVGNLGGAGRIIA